MPKIEISEIAWLVRILITFRAACKEIRVGTYLSPGILFYYIVYMDSKIDVVFLVPVFKFPCQTRVTGDLRVNLTQVCFRTIDNSDKIDGDIGWLQIGHAPTKLVIGQDINHLHRLYIVVFFAINVDVDGCRNSFCCRCVGTRRVLSI